MTIINYRGKDYLLKVDIATILNISIKLGKPMEQMDDLGKILSDASNLYLFFEQALKRGCNFENKPFDLTSADIENIVAVNYDAFAKTVKSSLPEEVDVKPHLNGQESKKKKLK